MRFIKRFISFLVAIVLLVSILTPTNVAGATQGTHQLDAEAQAILEQAHANIVKPN